MSLRLSSCAKQLAFAFLLCNLVACASSSTNHGHLTAAAYTELGMGYLAQGNSERAHQSFTRALALRDNEAGALHGMALLEQRDGNIAQADEYYQRTLQVLSNIHSNPDNASVGIPQVRNNYAALLFETGRLQEACQQLGQAAGDTHYPGRAGILVNLSQCQLRSGDSEGAHASLQEALRIAPRQPTVILAAAYMDFNDGNIDASQSHLSQYEHLTGTTRESEALKQALMRVSRTRDASAISDQPLNRVQ